MKILNTSKLLDLTCYALIFISVLMSTSVFAFRDKFPPPPKAQVTWVSKDMMLNGLPMAVRHFSTSLTPDGVLRYYRQLWRRPIAPELPGYKEAGTGAWQVISRIEVEAIRTVQVQPNTNGKGSWGYLGETDNSRADINRIKDVGNNFPKMRSTQVINDLHSNDPGKSGRTLLFTNTFTTNANASFYRRHYTDAGWKVLIDKQTNNTWVQSFKKGASKINLVIKRDAGATMIVANKSTESF